MSFEVNKKYTRKEIKALIGAPDPNNIGGNWTTGYTSFSDEYFIFANINAAGRTGHDYPNILTKDALFWYSKGNHSLNTPTIQNMISGQYKVHIFTRDNSNDPHFIYQGLGIPANYEDTSPVHIEWSLIEPTTINEVTKATIERKKYIEGAKKTSTVNRYERNKDAREACLTHYGYDCVVCGFNFEKAYGEVGRDFIHVHHEKEISSIGESYVVDPINDLKPVCPNCHAMLHKRRPAYSVNELKEFLKK
ncbi:DUF3427 domain-containing protein [Kurthia massiliensis]|uniref:DUF3427 domain-containing protein n=1 Tax=Kurthia massiliensis TaxID=1033739 RepID=UPI000289E89F|nr:DUF3427 domain-containing protein [Kurthia massiliensis]